MAYPWVKLWTEFVHDPKVGRLSEHLQLVFVKLLCIAGEADAEREGWLPSVEDMAWTLRQDDKAVEQDLADLEHAGLVACVDGTWLIARFADRQGPMSGAQRAATHRQRRQRDTYYGDSRTPASDTMSNDSLHASDEHVTNRYVDVDVDVDVEEEVVVDVDVEGARDAPQEDDNNNNRADPLVAQFYQGLKRLGVLVASDAQAEAYNEIIEDIRSLQRPEEFVDELIREAAKSTAGRITPRWFDAVVSRCARDGVMPGAARAPTRGEAAERPRYAGPEVDWSEVSRQIEGG